MIRRLFSVSAILMLGLSSFIHGQEKSQKRGICGDASPQDLAVLAPGVAWYYDWGVEPPTVSQGQLSGIEWVPMAWNAPASLTDFANRIPAGSLYLLGFNEPNFRSQANMTPAQAAAAWPGLEQIAADKGLKLVSPAVNWCGDCVDGVTNDPVDWLDKFFAACPGCKVDYIAIHSYAPGSEALRSYLDKFRKYNRPLWITEFAPWDPPKPDYEGVVKYMMEAIPILENDPAVFRYSWFATRVGTNPDISLLGASGVLTKLGHLYMSMAFPGLATDLPPVAFAGRDIYINQPATDATLNGSSYDANGDPVTITWTQESGPNTATFSSSGAPRPVVSGLVPGTYLFRITATAQGKTDSDEVSVKLGSPNIALLKPATSSSSEGSSTPPSAVNDGNMNTRWSSAFSDPQWIRIDLQEVYDLSGARIYWEASAAKSYEVQISQNGSEWIRAYYTSNGNGGIDDLSFQASARYVRIYSHSRVSQYGNSIWEFEVFGTVRTGIETTLAGVSFSVDPNPAAGGEVNLSFGKECGRRRCNIVNQLFFRTVDLL
ncbi:MAG: glycosyl hydrolase [Bacteroidales bacterium]|nr:glycosyl hydrolase [Bacteroidales bacterium]